MTPSRKSVASFTPWDTPCLKTNIEHENGWLEDAFPILLNKSLFRGHVVSGRVIVSKTTGFCMISELSRGTTLVHQKNNHWDSGEDEDF